MIWYIPQKEGRRKKTAACLPSSCETPAGARSAPKRVVRLASRIYGMTTLTQAVAVDRSGSTVRSHETDSCLVRCCPLKYGQLKFNNILSWAVFLAHSTRSDRDKHQGLAQTVYSEERGLLLWHHSCTVPLRWCVCWTAAIFLQYSYYEVLRIW